MKRLPKLTVDLARTLPLDGEHSRVYRCVLWLLSFFVIASGVSASVSVIQGKGSVIRSAFLPETSEPRVLPQDPQLPDPALLKAAGPCREKWNDAFEAWQQFEKIRRRLSKEDLELLQQRAFTKREEAKECLLDARYTLAQVKGFLKN